MFERFRQRSHELENIDKGTYTPEEYEDCLVELRKVNSWLGDTKALRESLLAEIERVDLRSFTILDVGAGSGELLRTAAEWARQTNRLGTFVGLELNTRSANAIREESTDFPEISALRANGLILPFPDKGFDYVLQSLTLHHFDDDGAVALLKEMRRVAARGVFVIDLHRNPMAYYFYKSFGKLFLHNRLTRQDGALSILRSFTPEEMEVLGQKAGFKNFAVEKHFPSRLVLRAKTNGAA